MIVLDPQVTTALLIEARDMNPTSIQSSDANATVVILNPAASSSLLVRDVCSTVSGE